MKKRVLVFKTRIPLYESGFALVIAPDVATGKAAIQKWIGGKPDNENHDCDSALALSLAGRHAIILGAESVCHGIIAHEVCHICFRLLQWHGIKISASNDEAFCYLHGWITDFIYRKTEKRNPA